MKMNMSGIGPKAITFLEKYCQWIALGLGVAWIMYIGYAFWVVKPVAIDIGKQSFSPHEIDEHIARDGGPISLLKAQIDPVNSKIPTEILKITKAAAPQYAGAFKNEMSGQKIAVALNPITSPIAGFDPNVIEKNTNPEEQKRATLAVILADTIVPMGMTANLAVIQKPVPAVNPNAPVPAAPVALVPNANGNVPNPVVANLAALTSEISWVTFEGQINMKKLADAFLASGLTVAAAPPVGAAASPAITTASTQFLRVQLVRQEQQADGSWGDEKNIGDLLNQSKPVFPPKLEDEGTYITWASANLMDIIRPAFYQIVRGAIWRTASMPEPVDAAALQPVAFDPAKVLPKDIPTLTPEQKKLYFEWKKAQDELNKPKPVTPRPTTPRPPTGGRGIPGAAPMAAPDQMISPPPIGRGSSMRGGGRETPPSTAMPGGYGDPNMNNPGAAAGGAGQGTFVPATTEDLKFWAHDETTVPGHTYRYKVKVWFKNPLFATQGLALNKDDEKKLAIMGESAYGDPITSPKKFDFYAVGITGAAGNSNVKMKFDYFYWSDGFWKSKQLSLQPGDAIGQSGWALADLRTIFNIASDNLAAIIVNELGESKLRTIRADKIDPEYISLTEKVKKAAADPANVVPGTAGLAPGTPAGPAFPPLR